MTTRRRFMADFKSRVALEALRGDKTIQEIASSSRIPPLSSGIHLNRLSDSLGPPLISAKERDRTLLKTLNLFANGSKQIMYCGKAIEKLNRMGV